MHLHNLSDVIYEQDPLSNQFIIEQIRYVRSITLNALGQQAIAGNRLPWSDWASDRDIALKDEVLFIEPG